MLSTSRVRPISIRLPLPEIAQSQKVLFVRPKPPPPPGVQVQRVTFQIEVGRQSPTCSRSLPASLRQRKHVASAPRRLGECKLPGLRKVPATQQELISPYALRSKDFLQLFSKQPQELRRARLKQMLALKEPLFKDAASGPS